VNADESSVASTWKLCCSPSARIAGRPALIASVWRKPVVFEKTRALKRGSCTCAAAGCTHSVARTEKATIATAASRFPPRGLGTTDRHDELAAEAAEHEECIAPPDVHERVCTAPASPLRR
jgi:hypothetical protein